MPYASCELDFILNLENITNSVTKNTINSQLLDTRVVSALSFVNITKQQQIIHKLIDISSEGKLLNTHIFINVSIPISSQSEIVSHQISPIGRVDGKMDNVSISGIINLTISNINNVRQISLSRLIGFFKETEIDTSIESKLGTYDSTNYPADYKGEFNFRNVSSSLKYFVNGAEIRDNQTINGVQFNISNGFDDVTVNVSNSDYQIQNDPNMHHFTYELTDSVTEKTSEITAWFAFPLNQGANNNANALDDLYPLSFQMSLEKFYETKGMMIRRFGSSGIELDFPYQNVDFVVYQENTKAVAINKQGQLTVCTGNLIFDLNMRQCIPISLCISKVARYLFQSTCAIQCPDKYVVFNKTCYSQCPQWLGAYQDSSSGLCAQCPSNQLATESGCVQSCSSFAFKYGCYQNCPAGTVVQGKTCTEPSSISECGSGEYLVLTGMLDGQRFYNTCETTGPSWMYRIVGQNNVQTNVYKAECRGLILPNNDCQEAGSPSEITNSGWCEEQCEIGEYFQPELQICHECLSDIYDGGLYFERNGLKCVSSCSKWSLSGTKKICEDKFPNNCPVWQVISAGQFQCQTSCSSSQFQDGQVCSSCDPALNKQVDKDSGGCLCKSGYFTLNMPDGSFTCTECDTTLNFKPSKEDSTCKCLDNAVYQNNKCIILCTSTQVILPGATSCSTCPQNTIPNVAQDGCVEKTGCAPGFLNVAGTFCVSSCASDSSIDGPSNQCVSCASKDPLTQFSSGQCVCVPGASKATSSASCACNQNFSPASGACSCSKKLSSDGQTCSDKCPAAEVSINGNTQCSTCASDFIPDEQQLECKKIIDTCPNNQYISLNQYQCVSSCVGGYIDETKCVLKCTDKLVDVSSQRCVTQCGANQLQISGYCKCAEAYIAKDNQCECYSNGGYSIIDGMCKCDSSLGRVTMSNQCVCDSYRGLAISGSQNICSCNTDLGFKSGSSISNCLCDVDKGFVLEPQLEDQGFVCLCNSAKGYKLNPRSIKPTCIKENKSMPIIGGIIGGILFLISLIILLLYYKKKKQQDNNNTNQKQTSQKVKQLKVKVPNKQERAPKILKLNQIQKNESISSVNKVQMMPIFQEQNNVQNYVDEQLIDNQSQYQQEKVNAVDAEQNIVSSPSEAKSKRASQLTSRMSQSRLQKSGFDQNAASTVLQSHFIDQSAQFDQIQLLQNEYISNNSSSRNQSGLSQKQQPGLKDNKKKFRRPEINAESFQGKKIDTQTIKNNIQLMQNRTKGLEPMKRSMKQVKMM
ncbi:Domain_of Conserved hypothetical protein function DUF5874 [Hexamita inflata]|uniref:EGF-like domain-containing protein n=1 Tax=Hexamita inflata TaxID=28002 RepID=A0ABP1JTX6_9EUKA